MDENLSFLYGCPIGLPVLFWFLMPKQLLRIPLQVLMIAAEAVAFFQGDILIAALVGWSFAAAAILYRSIPSMKLKAPFAASCSLVVAILAHVFVLWPVHHKPSSGDYLQPMPVQQKPPAEPDYLIPFPIGQEGADR